MTQSPPPPNQPPGQGGFGPPQDQPPQQDGAAQPPAQAPQPPAAQPQQPPQTPPPAGGPNLTKGPAPAPGYGYPQAPQGSQPPQAPQPPQGAPQTPPPAGPPQPQPGYGYPQAPQPPQTPPGYGYPQTPPGYGHPGPQPGPYAQQPGPYGAPQPGPYGTQQSGYGYPGQPTMPMHPQAGQPAGGRKVNAQLAIIVAAVVAIALIVGGGVWYAHSSGGSGKDDTASSSGGTGGKSGDGGQGGPGTSSGGKEKVPSDPAAKVLYQVPMPDVKDTFVTTGSWLTGKVYAKSGVAEIVGYDPDKGTKLWTIKLPGPVCQATEHTTADNRTAILYQPAMPTKAKPSQGCSQIAAIDLDAGRKLWTNTVKSGDRLVSLDNVTVSAGTVAVGSTSGGAAFDIATGKALWSPKPTDTCYDAGYGGGPKLVALRKCGQYGQRELRVQTIDPKSGKVISEYKMSQGIEYASVVSTDPLVVAADVGDSAGDGSGISDFFSIDDKTGKLRAHISAPGKEYAARCDGITRIEYCTGLAVGGDKLYVPTEEHDGDGEYSKTNEIVAFDLATGKQTGQRADAGDGYTITPLRMDGGNVIAYKRPPYDKGGQIVSIDGGSFKETELLENPATEAVRDAETSMSPDYAEILYARGHLYMSAVFAHKSSSSFGKEYLLLAFGTGG
ncbi:PQQ-binding-like beta-propeller repeat protein [Streptomyces sp. NPDC005526]|uniref:outer membrane protein assembly factor BamB family protein n=1 Tax=Streptomyces sp. NPDC005526 TaxID=3156885 RepID=UPI0033A92BD5